MLSLCNIYAPNNQAEQPKFLQELNNCLIDKSELTTGIERYQRMIRLEASPGKQLIIEI